MGVRFRADSQYLALDFKDYDSIKRLAVDLGYDEYFVSFQSMTLLSAAALEYLFTRAELSMP